MARWGLSRADVEAVLAAGTLVESYPDETPYPERLVLGWVRSMPVHVVVADGPDAMIVVTVYAPDPDRWDPTFQVRR